MPQTTIAEAALSPEERTPHNAPDATGSFKGLRRDHTLPDMVQAIMEGVDFAFADCCDALDAAGSRPQTVRFAGGGSQSQTWLQMIANITGLVLTAPESGSQGAALGAARLAILASDAGVASDVLTSARIERTFVPTPTITALFAERLEDDRSNPPTAV